MDLVSTFFRVHPTRVPLWIETVEGLSTVQTPMETTAAEEAGQYFVFSSRDQAILARINTLARPRAISKPQPDADVASITAGGS